MAYATDERLKSFLDSNQLAREQMCLAVLAIDKRFTDVKPRHPRGGPDGGRDIEAFFKENTRVFGAVGFLNQANDSDEHKGKAIIKFKSDVEAALSAEPNLKWLRGRTIQARTGFLHRSQTRICVNLQPAQSDSKARRVVYPKPALQPQC